MAYSKSTFDVEHYYQPGQDGMLHHEPEQSQFDKPQGKLRRLLERVTWSHGWFCFWSIGMNAVE
jgi:hypothetical protein